MRRLEFYYDFASTYAYLSAMRIDALAAEAGVEVAWRPFLLGPIFRDLGWETSPFNVYPVKGRYMVRDIQRIAAQRGLRFNLPNPFPANGLKAARVALLGMNAGWSGAFTKAVFALEFAERADIFEDQTLIRALSKAGQTEAEACTLLAAARSEAVKALLRQQTERAKAVGIFGAPTFVTEDGELFWGDDRLEQALDWAQR